MDTQAMHAWSSIGAWHPTQWGNFDRNRQERRINTYTHYRADYYGKGPQDYLRMTGYLQLQGGVPQAVPQWASVDGNPSAIAYRLHADGII